MTRILSVVFACLAAAVIPALVIGDEIPLDAVASAGGISTNAVNSVGCTVGLPLTGVATSATHEESVGFWRWFAPATSDIAPSGPGGLLPAVTRLIPNRPNPFRSSTGIPFEIAASVGTGVPVRLEVFDVLGRSVKVLVDEAVAPGTYLAQWDGRDSGAHTVPNGVYFARLRAGRVDATVRLVMAR